MAPSCLLTGATQWPGWLPPAKPKNVLADLNNFEKLETIFDKLESSALVPFFMKNMCRKKWKIGNLSLKIGKLNRKDPGIDSWLKPCP